MTITQKRKLRHKARRKRRQILVEIDELEKERCEVCRLSGWKATLEEYRCGCTAAVEIRKRGLYLSGRG